MKKYIFFILAFFICYHSIAQQTPSKDIVFTNDGDIKSGTLVEIAFPHYVRIMEDDIYLVPVRFKNIQKVVQNQTADQPEDIIYYKDGEIQFGIITEILINEKILFFDDEKMDTIDIAWQDVKNIKHTKLQLSRKLKIAYKGDYHYVSISPGIGLVHGGLGVRFQYRYGKDFGIGPHAGIGIGALAIPYYNLGLKFFFLNYLFLDVSYGTVGTHEERIPPYLSIEDVKLVNTDDFIFMIGLDIFYSKSSGITFSLGTILPNKQDKIREVFDVGYIAKIPIRPHKKPH